MHSIQVRSLILPSRPSSRSQCTNTYHRHLLHVFSSCSTCINVNTRDPQPNCPHQSSPAPKSQVAAKSGFPRQRVAWLFSVAPWRCPRCWPVCASQPIASLSPSSFRSASVIKKVTAELRGKLPVPVLYSFPPSLFAFLSPPATKLPFTCSSHHSRIVTSSANATQRLTITLRNTTTRSRSFYEHNYNMCATSTTAAAAATVNMVKKPSSTPTGSMPCLECGDCKYLTLENPPCQAWDTDLCECMYVWPMLIAGCDTDSCCW